MARPTRDNARDGRGSGEMLARKRSRYMEGVKEIDMNDHSFLGRFVTDFGKIIPARLTGVTAKQQRVIKRGIRRARNIGLLP